jgi:Zn-dependent oligopeptidase
VQLAKRLFDVDIKAVDGEAPIWDESVRFFRVDKSGEPKAYFFLDPYSRPAEKRSGAWFDEVVGQSKLVCLWSLLHFCMTLLHDSLPVFHISACPGP